MNLKELQAYQYALNTYESKVKDYNFSIKKWELILRINGQLLTADSFLCEAGNRLPFPKSYFFESETYIKELKPIYSNSSEVDELFSFLKFKLRYKIENLIDYHNYFESDPSLLLGRLEFILDQLDLTNVKQIINIDTLYNVKYLESKIELPFVKLNSSEDIEIISLKPKTEIQTQ